MTTPVIIDIIVAALLVTFTVRGMRRGLLRSLAGLAVALVALVGAGIIASTLAEPVAGLVTPLLRSHIEQRLDEALAQQTVQAPQVSGVPTGEETELSASAQELLELLGLDSDVRQSLAVQAEDRVRDTGVSLAMAVAESVAESVIYAALYLASFLALLVLMKLLAGAMDLVMKLPGLSLLNAAGGGIVGAIEGALLLFLAIWLLRRWGVSFETGTVDATYILRFFAANTPLSVLSLLQ